MVVSCFKSTEVEGRPPPPHITIADRLNVRAGAVVSKKEADEERHASETTGG